MNTTNAPRPANGLFLRVDGVLIVVSGGKGLEVPLSPRQLLQLGMDSLSIAVELQANLLGEAAEALESTYIVPMDEAPCTPRLS